MAEKLTWDEIKRRHPDEWVMLVDYAFNENEDLTVGVVYDHDAARDALYDRCSQAPSPVAVLYTGEIRGGMIGFYAEDVDPAA